MIKSIGLLSAQVKLYLITPAFLLTVGLSAPCFAQPAATISASENTTAAQTEPAVSSLIKRGRKALRHGQYAHARAIFEEALTTTPNSLRAQLGLASALYALGDSKASLAVLDQAIALADRPTAAAGVQVQSELHLMRSKVYQELKRFDEAVGDLSLALQEKGDCPEAYTCRATAFDALGKPHEAIDDLSKALALDPHNAQNYLARALLYKADGNAELALIDLNKAVDLDAQLLSWRASFEREQGRNQEAIADFTQVIESKDGNDKAMQLFDRGVIYEDLDEHRKAIADFTSALALHPDTARYYAHRGTSYFGVSDFKQAINDFTRAIKLDASNADHYFRRANAEVEDQRREDALADFNTAIKMDNGKHAHYFLKRADLESDLGNHGDAITDITRAIEISNGDPDYYFDRGMEYEVAGESKKSADDLSSCIKQRPEDACAYKNRALARMKLGDACGALEDLQRSARFYKDEGDRHGSAEVARLIQKVNQP